MYYHVLLELSEKAKKHFGCKEIVKLDMTDKDSLIKKLIEPIHKNQNFNFEGYRNINPDDVTRIVISESSIPSTVWLERKMASNGNGVYVMYWPTMIIGSEEAQDITEALFESLD